MQNYTRISLIYQWPRLASAPLPAFLRPHVMMGTTHEHSEIFTFKECNDSKYRLLFVNDPIPNPNIKIMELSASSPGHTIDAITSLSFVLPNQAPDALASTRKEYTNKLYRNLQLHFHQSCSGCATGLS